VEALHDGILRRVMWSTSTHSIGWRSLDFAIAQKVLDNMVSAYVKAVMLCREEGLGVDVQFVDEFSYPQEVWDILDSITTASSWGDVAIHDFHEKPGICPVCDTVYGRR